MSGLRGLSRRIGRVTVKSGRRHPEKHVGPAAPSCNKIPETSFLLVVLGEEHSSVINHTNDTKDLQRSSYPSGGASPQPNISPRS